MARCNKPEKIDSGSFIDTGSPHFIMHSGNIEKLKINETGRSYRHRTDLFGEGGANINFIKEIDTGMIFVRTFERGVEAETLSCGTGVTASAIVYGLENNTDFVKVETPGGHLEVGFKTDRNGHIYDVFLSGPTVKVFEGVVSI
jgi:diaminopimelate epimerase